MITAVAEHTEADCQRTEAAVSRKQRNQKCLPTIWSVPDSLWSVIASSASARHLPAAWSYGSVIAVALGTARIRAQ